MTTRFPYARTFLLGLGFFGISLIWPIFNNYVPILLYYFASSIAAVAGPQLVGILIQLTGDNYRIMFAFSALFMILAGVCMAKVKDPFRSLKSQAAPA